MDLVISEDICEFLREKIDGFEQLDVLLLARRERVAWRVDSVSAELRISFPQAEDALRALCAQNLLAESAGAFEYSPVPATQDELVGSLEQAWREKSTALIGMISRQAIARVRNSAMRAFADAFLLGRNGKKDG